MGVVESSFFSKEKETKFSPNWIKNTDFYFLNYFPSNFIDYHFLFYFLFFFALFDPGRMVHIGCERTQWTGKSKRTMPDDEVKKRR
jgi:hypothetical protein